MKVVVESGILLREGFSGVEVYTKSLLEAMEKEHPFTRVMPKKRGRLERQKWLHTTLSKEVSGHDLLFCPANIAPWSLSKKTKLIVTLHDVAFKRYPDTFSKAFRLYYNLLIPRVIKRADQLITVSDVSKEEILSAFPYAKGKIEVIPIACDPIFTSDQSVKKEKTLLYVGSMNERKNFVGAINAFEALEKEEYTLQMVGNFYESFALSNASKEVLERAKKNPKIEFVKGVSNEKLSLLYRKATLFLFPSFYEGFGIPPLEAMASGTPVITSQKTSMQEVCEDAALYVDPHDQASLIEAMRTLLDSSHKREEMMQKGLLQSKKFSWEATAKKHWELFERVVG